MGGLSQLPKCGRAALNKIAKKTISFGVVKEYMFFESWPQLLEGAVDGMKLVEEKDWGMPWPDILDNDDSECNLRVFELDILTMPVTREFSEQLERLKKIEEAKKKVRALLARRRRYIRLMVRQLFKLNTEKMSRAGYNYYTRIIAMMIGILGTSTVFQLEIRIAVFSMAYTIAFVMQ